FLAQADTINVSAGNPEIRTIAISGTPTFNFPSANFGGVTSQSIGSVNIKSNSADGYKLTVASANVANLKSTINAIDYSIPYTLIYASGNVVIADTTAVTVETKAAGAAGYLDCANDSGCDRALALTVTEANRQAKPSGTYTDTLTVSIAAP
ncbi:MAG: hypothetical protein H7Y22_17225, partial [Gemmatimonadaceae bacterium]|nr:hypothetical protein [Gloeobacterales cyanobacterium ES-bin-141]